MSDLLPYFSQWGDLACNDEVVARQADPSQLHDWASDGYPTREDYLFWSRRICGLACLQSLLHGWTQERMTMRHLLSTALDRGCYAVDGSGGVQGLLYHPFVAWMTSQFGFGGQVVEHTPIASSALEVGPGQVLLASVSPQIRDPSIREPRRGGHLVLVHQANEGVLTFHNPSGFSFNAVSTSLATDVFQRFHADRGILIRRTT